MGEDVQGRELGGVISSISLRPKVQSPDSLQSDRLMGAGETHGRNRGTSPVPCTLAPYTQGPKNVLGGRDLVTLMSGARMLPS